MQDSGVLAHVERLLSLLQPLIRPREASFSFSSLEVDERGLAPGSQGSAHQPALMTHGGEGVCLLQPTAAVVHPAFHLLPAAALKSLLPPARQNPK